jgi:hypothetical protein
VGPAVVDVDLLIGSGAGTEKVMQLVVGPAEFASRSWALEPVHRTVAAFDTTMILLAPRERLQFVTGNCYYSR